MKHFYTYLIETYSLTVELDELNLDIKMKNHLAKLIDSTLHHAILDAVLSELSDFDKRVFINHISNGDNDKIWKMLKEKVKDVESKIKKTAEDIKDELRSDIKNAKKIKER